MKQHQFARYGESNGRAKLTTEKVQALREAIKHRDEFLLKAQAARKEAKRLFDAARALKNANLCRRYGISEASLKSAVYGENWKHVR